ncbi:hypothetical protein PoB_007498800 [Plakobranchus ocellatus]|uniref:Uncharacterized protein n=1 Tax=Plakobranchus ocellatus TaxID=259542 RepID=A0AAV4DW61_9GAST|nr:hypothetical protein PoB_007498800 [Plakobranchus ocellatus]
MKRMHLGRLHSYKIARATFMRMFQTEGDSVYHCAIQSQSEFVKHCITNAPGRKSEASDNLHKSNSLAYSIVSYFPTGRDRPLGTVFVSYAAVFAPNTKDFNTIDRIVAHCVHPLYLVQSSQMSTWLTGVKSS